MHSADPADGGAARTGGDELDVDAYDAVVYDLDGTLVRLAVDWGAVAEEVIDVYEANAVAPPSDRLWDLLEAAPGHELVEAVEAVIAAHEREGARRSEQLPLSNALTPDRATRTAVCSLNCENACRIALRTHSIDGSVGAVVGRDTVGTHKPDPEPLLAAVDALDSDPERTLFVGDSARDAKTAERAGVPFEYVD